MTRLGFSLTAEAMDSDAVPEANQLAWELEIAKKSLHDTPEGEAVVVHRVADSKNAPEGARVYYLRSPAHSNAIAVSHSDTLGHYTQKPWLIIGRNAEEYWA